MDKIIVPSNWQMQGYDHQMYRNIPMNFNPYSPPEVPDDINPTGLYRREFEIPLNWNGRKTFIHFDGIQSAAFIWVNEKYVGYHEDGMTPAEFNITGKIVSGKNLIAVMVIRWCTVLISRIRICTDFPVFTEMYIFIQNRRLPYEIFMLKQIWMKIILTQI